MHSLVVATCFTSSGRNRNNCGSSLEPRFIWIVWICTNRGVCLSKSQATVIGIMGRYLKSWTDERTFCCIFVRSTRILESPSTHVSISHSFLPVSSLNTEQCTFSLTTLHICQSEMLYYYLYRSRILLGVVDCASV